MAIDVTDELVAHIARLSRLGLSADEADEIKGHFQKILQFVEVLDQLDLSKVDPSIFALEISNILRRDEVQPSLPTEVALQNAPDTGSNHFLVPRIIGAPGKGADPEEFS